MLKKNFKVNNSIYPTWIINIAIKDFSEVTTIKFKNWVIEISWEDNKFIDEVFNEFMNYVIWLYNEAN